MTFTITGRVVRSVDLAPLAGQTVRFIAQQAAMREMTAVEPLPAGQIDWTGRLSGFSGSRWDCWEQHINGKVPITWADFRDNALIFNPQLSADGRLFQRDKIYLLPEISPPLEPVWTGRLAGFSGSRWDCWEQHISGKVPISWAAFRDGVLSVNPQLVTDGRLFQRDKLYCIPELRATCRAAASTTTDTTGQYRFTGVAPDAAGILEVTASGYTPARVPVVVNGPLTQPITLNGGPQSGMRSALPGYAGLPPRLRTLIDQALALLGDERTVFDALPANLRPLCYGNQFLDQPNSMHYKDIVCADLVTIALTMAGCNLSWSNSGANPHMAHFYMPGPSPLQEITDPGDWLPGDVLVYGNHGAARAGHVNLYVGPLQGVDRSGTSLPLSAGYDVVEASMNFDLSSGQRWGLGNIALTRASCLSAKRGYQWVRRVRLKAIAALG